MYSLHSLILPQLPIRRSGVPFAPAPYPGCYRKGRGDMLTNQTRMERERILVAVGVVISGIVFFELHKLVVKVPPTKTPAVNKTVKETGPSYPAYDDARQQIIDKTKQLLLALDSASPLKVNHFLSPSLLKDDR